MTDYTKPGEKTLRVLAYNLGYPLKTNEMQRSFYLKNRLTKIERQNMLNIFKIIEKSALKNKLSFPYAVLGIGTSTYSDEYFKKLKNFFFNNGLKIEDTITEEAGFYSPIKELSSYKDYNDYVNCLKKENQKQSFDEQLPIFSEKKFLDLKSREQKEYVRKIKIKDIFKKKGEDLDFIICPDNNIFSNVLDSTKNKMQIFKVNLKNKLSEQYDVLIESSHLSDSYYKILNEKITKSKQIEAHRETWRIDFSQGRSFHFYFQNKINAIMKIKNEIINNYYFTQIVRNNFNDLKDTIKHGEKTGIFENPYLLEYLKTQLE